MNLSKLNHSNEMNRLSKSDSKLNSRFKFSTPSGKRNFETFWIWTHFPRFGFSNVNMSSTTVLETTLHWRRNNFWWFMVMGITDGNFNINDKIFKLMKFSEIDPSCLCIGAMIEFFNSFPFLPPIFSHHNPPLTLYVPYVTSKYNDVYYQTKKGKLPHCDNIISIRILYLTVL